MSDVKTPVASRVSTWRRNTSTRQVTDVRPMRFQSTSKRKTFYHTAAGGESPSDTADCRSCVLLVN